MSEAFDTIIGKAVLERGWVTRDQLVDCLRQCGETDDSSPSKSGSKLTDVLVSRGLVRPDQMDSLRREISKIIETDGDYEIVRKGDSSLGQVLVKSGALTKEQLIEALSVQSYAASKGVPPRLGEVLLQKGFVTFALLEKALLSQKEKTPLQCGTCGSSFAVIDFDPKKKYLCKKCTGLLLPPQQATADIPDEVKQAAQNPKNTLGKYTVVTELGRGGMGAVYKAWDGPLKRWVALKVLLQTGGKDELARFRREAQTAAALRHPTIVGIYEVVDIGDKHVIAMEFVDGRSLNGLKLPVRKAADILVQVCEAVEYAHSKGIIHRDIKPHNVMLDKEDHPFVMDFGLAKSLEGPSHITVSGAVVGTPSYMPPEQAEGHSARVGKVSDVYSLGAVLYEVLTGRPPFKGKNAIDTLRQVVNEDPPPPSQFNTAVLPDLETIVLKALEKDPARRYPSAKALAADLSAFAAGREIHAKRAALGSRVGKKLRRHWAPFVAVGAAAVAALAIALVIAGSGSSRENEQKIRDLAARAERQFQDGDFATAKASYAAIAALDPANADAKRRIPECEKRIKAAEEGEKRKLADAQKKRDEARAKAQPEFDTGRTRMDRALKTLYQPGADLGQTEQFFDEAVGHFSRAIALLPEHHEALHLRGRSYVLRSNYPAAERDFSAAIGHLKSFSIAYYDRGRCYIAQATEAARESRREGAGAESEAKAFREKAKADLSTYKQLGGGDPEQTQLAEALLAFSEKDYGQAIRVCDALIAAGTPNEEVYKLKGDALYARLPDPYTKAELKTACEAAVQAYTQAIGKRVNYPEAYLERGQMHFLLGDSDAALKDLEKAVPPGSKNVQAYVGRSAVFYLMYKDPESLADLERALKLDPSNSDALTRTGVIHYAAKDYPKALDFFERAVKADPKSVNALVNRGSGRQSTGDFIGALADFDEAQKINPRYSEIKYRIAMVHYNRKDWSQAEDQLSRYLADMPDAEKGYFYRGGARYNKKDWAAALQDWEKCVSLKPSRKADLEARMADARKRLGQ